MIGSLYLIDILLSRMNMPQPPIMISSWSDYSRQSSLQTQSGQFVYHLLQMILMRYFFKFKIEICFDLLYQYFDTHDDAIFY